MNFRILSRGLGPLLFVQTLMLSNSANAIEEVVVEATRREQSTQDISVSVTAFSGKGLKELGLSRGSQLGDQTPNLSIVEGNFGLARPIISLRGVSNDDFTAVANQPIIIYSDDVLINSSVVQGFAFVDVDRVEVLRGPQGTLFGRNAIAGAIQYFSKKPTEELTGEFSANVGNFGLWELNGSVSVPLIDDWLLSRVAVSKHERTGYIENTVTDKIVGERDWLTGRLFLQMPEKNGLSALFKAQYIETNGETNPFHNSLPEGNEFIRQTPQFLPTGIAPPLDQIDPVANPGLASFLFGADGIPDADLVPRDYARYPNVVGADEDYEKITSDLDDRPERIVAREFSIKLDWEFERFSLTSITAHLENTFFAVADLDGTQFVLLHSINDDTQEQFSQEFRVGFDIGSANIVAGALLFG